VSRTPGRAHVEEARARPEIIAIDCRTTNGVAPFNVIVAEVDHASEVSPKGHPLAE